MFFIRKVSFKFYFCFSVTKAYKKFEKISLAKPFFSKEIIDCSCDSINHLCISNQTYVYAYEHIYVNARNVSRKCEHVNWEINLVLRTVAWFRIELLAFDFKIIRSESKCYISAALRAEDLGKAWEKYLVMILVNWVGDSSIGQAITLFQNQTFCYFLILLDICFVQLTQIASGAWNGRAINAASHMLRAALSRLVLSVFLQLFMSPEFTIGIEKTRNNSYSEELNWPFL